MKHKPVAIGEKFGRLTVLEEIKQSGLYWLKCQCLCGKITFGPKSSITSGNKQSCGCLKGAIMSAVSLQYHSLPGDEAAFRRLYSHYRVQARNQGHVFELTPEEFRYITGLHCFYCGCAPAKSSKYRCRIRGTRQDYVYNGIDRINSAGGYTAENVVPCCSTCNRAKMALSVQDFYDWIRRVSAYLESKNYGLPFGMFCRKPSGLPETSTFPARMMAKASC